MEAMSKDLPPHHTKQPLQQLLQSSAADVKQLLQFLPEDVQRVLATPEGQIALFLTAVLGVIALLWLLTSRRTQKGSTIVVAGPVNAGKTTLFYQLKDGTVHNGMVASMQENGATCPIKGTTKAVRLVDIPGHASFRHKLESSVKDACGIVFLVDAVEVTPHRVEAAELLYEILVNSAVQKSRTPILIACNKMDLEMDAHSVDFIRKTLEKQVDSMRKTKTASIGKDAGGMRG